MDDVSIRDLKMMYDGSLILRNGIPVFIRSVEENKFVHAWNLVSQKFIRFKFKSKDLAPPSFRLGYVNIGTACFYTYRVPSRVYKIGMSSSNVVFKRGDHTYNRAEELEISRVVDGLSSVSLYKTIKGIFPSLKEAHRQAVEHRGCVAFDRQFAVDRNSQIYFRAVHVGAYNGESIDFISGKSHLINNLPGAINK